MNTRITPSGSFKSDKYDWCPEGYFVLKFSDPEAHNAIEVFANSTSDMELAGDLRVAVDNARRNNESYDD